MKRTNMRKILNQKGNIKNEKNPEPNKKKTNKKMHKKKQNV